MVLLGFTVFCEFEGFILLVFPGDGEDDFDDVGDKMQDVRFYQFCTSFDGF